MDCLTLFFRFQQSEVTKVLFNVAEILIVAMKYKKILQYKARMQDIYKGMKDKSSWIHTQNWELGMPTNYLINSTIDLDIYGKASDN